MVAGQHKKRDVPGPDEFHQHQCRFDCTPFRCGDHDNIAGLDALAEFFRGCFYAEREPVLCFSDKQEGAVPRMSSSPSSRGYFILQKYHPTGSWDRWVFFPMPLNRSPHSLHR